MWSSRATACINHKTSIIVICLLILCAHLQSPSACARSKFEQACIDATHFAYLHKLKEALACADSAIAANCKRPEGYCHKGLAYMESGQYENALTELNKAIRLAPRYKIAYERRLYCHMMLQRFKDGIADCKKVLLFDPANKSALKDLIVAYRKVGREDLAAGAEAFAFTQNTNLARGETSLRAGRVEEAVKLFTSQIKQFPRQVDGYKYRARAYKELNQYDKATSDYRMVVEIDPTDFRAHERLAETHETLRQYMAAAEDLTMVAYLFPCQWHSIFNRAVLYRKAHEYDRAISEYTDLLKSHKGSEEIYRARGDCYVALGKFNEAIRDYTLAIQNDLELTGSTYHARAEAYDRIGKFELARKDRDKARQLDAAY